MSAPLNHVLHAVIVSLLLYVIMRFVLKQSELKSQTRSVFMGLVAGLYMIMFGHQFPPSQLNNNIM